LYAKLSNQIVALHYRTILVYKRIFLLTTYLLKSLKTVLTESQLGSESIRSGNLSAGRCRRSRRGMKCASRVGSEVRKIKARKLPGKPCSKAYSRVVQAPHQTQPSGHGSPQANALTAGPSRLLKESNHPNFQKFGVLKCFVKPYETSFSGKTKFSKETFKVQPTPRQQLEPAQYGASRCVQTAQYEALVQTTRQKILRNEVCQSLTP
jgi:hypothetical protein